jgi:hypothetical protein
LVVVGTVAILGVSVGLSVVASSVNQELQDVGFAIRSLDQSYEIPGQASCRAYTAGSSFRQQPVELSLMELGAVPVDFAETSRTTETVEETSDEVQPRKSRKKKSDRTAKWTRSNSAADTSREDFLAKLPDAPAGALRQRPQSC